MAETIGSLIDKISIMGLKTFYMGKQTERTDVSEEHREACRQKLKILQEQQGDLAKEAQQLIEDVLAGRKTLKIYRQFKMYNDPTYRTKP